MVESWHVGMSRAWLLYLKVPRHGQAVGYDDAASLNFLANGWLETHTPSPSLRIFYFWGLDLPRYSTRQPPHHTSYLPYHQKACQSFPSNSQASSLCRLSILPSKGTSHISSLHDKPAFSSPAPRMKIKTIHLSISPSRLPLHSAGCILPTDTALCSVPPGPFFALALLCLTQTYYYYYHHHHHHSRILISVI